MRKDIIAAEFARRAKRFNPGIEPMKIELWGLFSWGAISKMVKSGEIIPNTGYSKINKTLWCRPSEDFYNSHIAPLMEKPLDELSRMAGWG